MKRKTIILTLLFLLSGIMLLPLFTNNRTNPLAKYKSTDLSELEFDEIEFTNNTDKIKLGGLIFQPKGKGPFPVAIIIHGSGSSDRKNIWYLDLAKNLQQRGITVLLPDKRGSEKSEGNWVGKSVEELANDTTSAIDFIRTQYKNSFSGIGIIGVSQGGWIAPVVAAKSTDLDFVINISGSFTTAEEQLLFEERNNINQYTYDFVAHIIAPLTTENLKSKASVAPFVGFTPVAYWEKVKSPSFIAYGENDTNCPVPLSISRIKEKNLKNITLKVYPDGRHAILDESKTRISDSLFNDLEIFITNSIDTKITGSEVDH